VEYLNKKIIFFPTSLRTAQTVGQETANQQFLRDFHSKEGIHYVKENTKLSHLQAILQKFIGILAYLMKNHPLIYRCHASSMVNLNIEGFVVMYTDMFHL